VRLSNFLDWGNDPAMRFKRESPKSVTPPALPPPTAAPPSEISPQVQAAGQAEGRNLRKKTGRRATRLTRPELAFVPAATARAGLKTKLGATV
jgi:hypothetical protein